MIFNKQRKLNSDELKNELVKSLGPLKKPYKGNILNKAGRVILRGKLEGEDVKVYEAWNPQHANFIKKMSSHEDLADFFPEVYGIYGRFVICQWSKGRIVKEHLRRINSILKTQKQNHHFLERLASLQTKIHYTGIASLGAPVFDYLQDFLWPRFLRATELLNEKELAEDIHEKFQSMQLFCKDGKLLHPDLTPANVIVTPKNKLQIIDNELVSTGNFQLLDICNTINNISSRYRRLYTDLYFEKSNLHLSYEDICVLQATWTVRVVGSAFVGGQISAAQKLLLRYKNSHNILPIDFNQYVS